MYKTETKAVDVCICDLCEAKVPMLNSRCHGCERHVCGGCGSVLRRCPWNGLLYPVTETHRFCDTCRAILEPLAKQAAEIRSEAEVRIDRLRALWERRCKQNMEAKE